MIPRSNSLSTRIAAIEAELTENYKDRHEVVDIDLATIVGGVIEFKSPDMAFCHMGGIEINVLGVTTPFVANIYFSNSGAKTGTIQGTIPIAAGDSDNFVQINIIPSRYIIVELNGVADGTLSSISLIAKR